MAKRREGKLAAAGFRSSGKKARRYIDTEGRLGPKGREVSYRAAFQKSTGRSLEKAVHEKGKFRRTLDTAHAIRDAAERHDLSKLKVVTVAEERRLLRSSVKTLMRGHSFKSSLRRGISAERRGEPSPIERRTPYGKLLAVLHDDIRMPPAISATGKLGWLKEHERVAFRRRYYGGRTKAYLRRFGPNSRKAKLLVAMGLRDAGATYDVGETP